MRRDFTLRCSLDNNRNQTNHTESLRNRRGDAFTTPNQIQTKQVQSKGNKQQQQQHVKKEHRRGRKKEQNSIATTAAAATINCCSCMNLTQ